MTRSLKRICSEKKKYTNKNPAGAGFCYTETMKISVAIIAHNEEEYIEKCITSVLHQTRPADEVVLVAHNCTDQTVEIAKKYPITVIPYDGPKGIIYARLESLKYLHGDIVLCIDGDSYARKNWIEVLSKTLADGRVFAGSWILS